MVDDWLRLVPIFVSDGTLRALGEATAALIGNPLSAGRGVLSIIAAVVLVVRSRRVLPGLIGREPAV